MIPESDTMPQKAMPKKNGEPLAPEVVERYLRSVLRKNVRILALRHLGGPKEGKGFGYGVPVLVEYEVRGEAGRTSRQRAGIARALRAAPVARSGPAQ